MNAIIYILTNYSLELFFKKKDRGVRRLLLATQFRLFLSLHVDCLNRCLETTKKRKTSDGRCPVCGVHVWFFYSLYMFAGIWRPEKFHLNVSDLSPSGKPTKEKKIKTIEGKKITLQQVLSSIIPNCLLTGPVILMQLYHWLGHWTRRPIKKRPPGRSWRGRGPPGRRAAALYTSPARPPLPASAAPRLEGAQQEVSQETFNSDHFHPDGPGCRFPLTILTAPGIRSLSTCKSLFWFRLSRAELG